MNSLKRLLKKKVLVVPGAFDCMSALLIREAGFEAAYLTGAGLSVSFLGKPDIGLLTLDEVVGEARRIVRACGLPLIVDGDTGFGGDVNVARLVRELEQTGAAAVQIEDQTFPKRCGHLEGKSVVPLEIMVRKIRAAVRARKNKDFLIIARTDARGVTSWEDALKRARAYKAAGADIIFPEALKTREEFAIFAKKGLGTLMANMTEFGHSPALTAADLAHLGYRLVLFPMTAFRVAAHSMELGLQELRRAGTSRAWEGRMQTRKRLYEIIRYADYNEKDERWLAETDRLFKKTRKKGKK